MLSFVLFFFVIVTHERAHTHTHAHTPFKYKELPPNESFIYVRGNMSFSVFHSLINIPRMFFLHVMHVNTLLYVLCTVTNFLTCKSKFWAFTCQKEYFLVFSVVNVTWMKFYSVTQICQQHLRHLCLKLAAYYSVGGAVFLKLAQSNYVVFWMLFLLAN